MTYKVIDNFIAYPAADKKAAELADKVSSVMKILSALPAEDLEQVTELRDALEQAKSQYAQLSDMKRYVKTNMTVTNFRSMQLVLEEAAKYLASTQSTQ